MNVAFEYILKVSFNHNADELFQSWSPDGKLTFFFLGEKILCWFLQQLLELQDMIFLILFFFFKDLEILALTKEDFLFFLIQSSQFSFEIGEYGICRIRSSTGPFCTSSQSVFSPKCFQLLHKKCVIAKCFKEYMSFRFGWNSLNRGKKTSLLLVFLFVFFCCG